MTKQCSENLVNHKAHGLPAGIFRPPIVLSTYKEPVPGWTGIVKASDYIYICKLRVRKILTNLLMNRIIQIIFMARVEYVLVLFVDLYMSFLVMPIKGPISFQLIIV